MKSKQNKISVDLSIFKIPKKASSAAVKRKIENVDNTSTAVQKSSTNKLKWAIMLCQLRDIKKI